MQFKDWKMSNQEDLLTKEVLDHFENFKEEEREGGGGKKKKRDDGKPYYKSNQMSSKGINNFKTQNTKEAPNSTPAPTQENSMEQWARKDLTKEIKAAEEFKQKLEETIKDDPIKRNLRGFLNMLTKDNYEETKAQILGVIKDNVDYQVKFLDVLFQKAVCAYGSIIPRSDIPEILHCQDASTAMLPAFIANSKNFKKTNSVVTIHNAGPFYHHSFSSIGEAAWYTGLETELLENGRCRFCAGDGNRRSSTGNRYLSG